MKNHENRPGTINKQKRHKHTDKQNLPIIYRYTFRHLRGYPTDLRALGTNFMANFGQKSDLNGLCGIGYWVWSIST